MGDLKYLTRLEQLEQLGAEELNALSSVEDKFVFRTNTYYNALIDWADPNDPLKKLSLPNLEELEDWGKLDYANEGSFVVVPNLLHKYQATGTLFVNNVCGSICRYCYRKHFFMEGNDDVTNDVSEALEYISSHKEMTNVNITGGDPFLMSARKMERYLIPLYEMDHLNEISFCTRLVAYNPFRIIEDSALHNLLARCNTKSKRITIQLHFCHPREITEEAKEAVFTLVKCGCNLWNHTPILQGVNSDPKVLAELINRLGRIGVPMKYLYILYPTEGNKLFSLPLEESLAVFLKAKGLEKGGLNNRTVRLIVSDEILGDVEVLGKIDNNIYFKFHRPLFLANDGRVFFFKSNPQAIWISDYKEFGEFSNQTTGE